MDVNLSDDQRAFVRQAIAAGRFDREEDAVREALALWEERERVRAELLTAIHSADVSLAQGGGRSITENSMRELASDVKRRGRARLDRERHGPNR
jgi:antitoxin ParD1/3/4